MSPVSRDILWVFSGGFIGCLLRIVVEIQVYDQILTRHNALTVSMLATLIVNMLGALLLGALYALHQRERISLRVWQFAGIGLCGAFTTFSAVMLESFISLRLQLFDLLVIYALGSLVVCTLTAALGYWLVARNSAQGQSQQHAANGFAQHAETDIEGDQDSRSNTPQ
ncbi:MAG: CrcB family protein [Firmicutes bacterium]|nr:CrcB family protein [Bacillota bacterium]